MIARAALKCFPTLAVIRLSPALLKMAFTKDQAGANRREVERSTISRPCAGNKPKSKNTSKLFTSFTAQL